MPGIFSIRSGLEQEQQITDLLDLILYRDARYVRTLDPELGKEILLQISRLKKPSSAQIAEALQVDSRKIKKHIEVLREIFVIHQVDPHRSGFGKSLYFLYDCSIARFLGADQIRCLQTWFLNEQLSQRTSLGQLRWKIGYYSTQKGRCIDFLIEVKDQLCAVKLTDRPHVRKIDVLILKEFKKKVSGRVHLVVLGPFAEAYVEDEMEFFPFESVG